VQAPRGLDGCSVELNDAPSAHVRPHGEVTLTGQADALSSDPKKESAGPPSRIRSGSGIPPPLGGVARGSVVDPLANGAAGYGKATPSGPLGSPGRDREGELADSGPQKTGYAPL
jgi:hypothetical protein